MNKTSALAIIIPVAMAWAAGTTAASAQRSALPLTQALQDLGGEHRQVLGQIAALKTDLERASAAGQICQVPVFQIAAEPKRKEVEERHGRLRTLNRKIRAREIELGEVRSSIQARMVGAPAGADEAAMRSDYIAKFKDDVVESLKLYLGGMRAYVQAFDRFAAACAAYRDKGKPTYADAAQKAGEVFDGGLAAMAQALTKTGTRLAGS